MVMFARSLESDKFEILVEILDQLLTWMFFLNQVHYDYLINTLKFMKGLKKVDVQFKKHSDIFLEYQMIKVMNKIIRLLKESVMQ